MTAIYVTDPTNIGPLQTAIYVTDPTNIGPLQTAIYVTDPTNIGPLQTLIGPDTICSLLPPSTGCSGLVS